MRIATLLAANVLTLAFVACKDDTSEPVQVPPDAADARNEKAPLPDVEEPPTCAPGDVTSFAPTATKGVVAPHQKKCSADQLKAFVSCLKDFQANEADCKAWGFDPSKSISTAFTGDCATCLFALPNKPGTALKVDVIGKSAYLGLNEVACVEAFGGAECGKQGLAVNDCAKAACGEAQGCTDTTAIQKCMGTAIQKGCGKYTQAVVGCVDGSQEPDADGGNVSLGDAGNTSHPSVDLCGKFASFTGDDTPDDVTYAWANYLCGN